MNKAKQQAVTGLFVLTMLLAVTGCNKSKEAASTPTAPVNPAAAVNDPRMPPAQKAIVEQNMAAQKANAALIDQKMKAYAAKKP